jgi:carboxymethylenebutenolidase
VSDIATSTVRCEGGLPAFLAVPAAATKLPAVVLMHERYGLVQHTRDLAARFARDGFACIAPDFFHKHPDQAALHRGDVGYDMTDPEAVFYLDAALAELGALPQVDRSKISVAGVCQTGRHPLVLAAQRPIAAALVWYGAASQREWQVNARYPEPLEAIIARVECPVLGLFGEEDHVISLADVRRLRDCLDRHDKSYTIKVYADAPHGWPTTPCRAATDVRRPRPAGRCSAHFSMKSSIQGTTARGEFRSTNASIPPIMISARTCGWSSAALSWPRKRASGNHRRGVALALCSSSGDYWIVRLHGR